MSAGSNEHLPDVIAAYRDAQKQKPYVKFILHPLVIAVFSILASVIGEAFIHWIWPYLTSFLHVWWFRAVGTLTVLLIGWGLFRFKKHYQTVYGMAEIGFALTGGWASLGRVQIAQDISSWIAVIASAYLVVRGLTNYEEGKNKLEEGQPDWPKLEKVRW